MATTATTEARERVAVGRKGAGVGGPRTGGPRRGPNGHNGDGHARREEEPRHYRIGMLMALAAIAMMFAALTSAYVMRAGTVGWQEIALPRLLWASTALIAASSVTFEVARRALRRGEEGAYRRWLAASLVLGLCFLTSQLLAWQRLVAQGVYLASNPHSSFFYLLTGLHGLHLAGGIAGLSYLLWRAPRAPAETRDRASAQKQRAAADAVGIYWHFMDGLWVYIFALLFIWR